MTPKLLERLCALLEAERAAVAALDFAAIERISAEKMALLPSLTKTTDATMAPLLRRLRSLANAQAALYSDAVATINCVLVGPPQAATYDARARVRRSTSVRLAKGAL